MESVVALAVVGGEDGNKATSPPRERRSMCGGCGRPLAVCICHVIPSPPIPTRTQIIIIQHPHESRHKLNTTPLLTRSLQNCTSVTARRLTPANAALLPLAHHSKPPPTYYLFPPSPSSPAVSLSRLAPAIPPDGPVLLVVFDATWKHAKEMVGASEAYLAGFATRVCLDGFDRDADGGSIFDSELLLRKEPCGGCVSTAEAVARWLGVVERDGPRIEGRLVGVLKEVVRLQAQFLKPVRPRPKLEKKKRNNNAAATHQNGLHLIDA